MSAKIITTTNGKGGTGKTTSNVLIAETFCQKGKKVLVIDLDFNCCISEVYKHVLMDETSKALLLGKAAKPYRVKANESGGFIDIIPSDLDMNTLSNIMDTQLKIQLKKSGLLEKYDYIILDPPGTWNAQNRNAVFAADTVIVITTPSSLDFNATIKFFEQLSNCMLESDVMVVVNKTNAKLNLDGILERYAAQFGEYLVDVQIPDIKSLKRLVSDSNYRLHPAIAKRLKNYIAAVTGEREILEKGGE